ncbi:MAG: outer membrane beta-barrel protein [Bacteroidota bacterium]
MNHQDKFWQAFRDKVEDYSGSDYNATEWAAIEQMLDGGGTTNTTSAATAAKPWWAFWQLWVGVLILSGIAFWALATTDLNYHTSATESKKTEAELSMTNENVVEEEQLTAALMLNPDQNETINEQLPERQPALAENTAQEANDSPLSTRMVVTEANASTDQTEVSSSTTALSNATEQTTLAEAPANNLSEPAPEAVEENLPPALPTEEEQEEVQQEMAAELSSSLAASTKEQLSGESQERLNFAPTTPLATAELVGIEGSVMEEALPVGYQTASSYASVRWRPGFLFGASAILTNTGGGEIAYGPTVGLSLQRQLSRRWGIELEVMARLMGNYDLTISATDTFVNLLGQVVSHTESNTVQEYLSLDIPLVFRYRTNQRWTMVGGLRYSYLVPTATAGSIQLGSGQSAAVLERVRAKQIWEHDYGVLLGLEYSFLSDWSLQMRYTQSLIDLSPDNLYQSTETHLNADLQITARKKF